MKQMKFNLDDFKGDLIIALKLTAICFVAVLLLSVVNLLTYKKIASNNEQTVNQTNQLLLPNGKTFEKASFDNISSDKQCYYIVKDQNGELIGYTALVLTSGYGGEMSMMIGFDKNLVITNVKLLNNSETPGVGKNAEKPHYMDKFVGTNSKSKPIPLKKSMLSQNDSDAITGATITFNGITNGLKSGVALLQKQLENVVTNDVSRD